MSMWKLCAVIVVIIFDPIDGFSGDGADDNSTASPSFEKLEVIQDFCSPLMQLSYETVVSYFSDQYYLTILDLDKVGLHAMETLTCFNVDHLRAVDIIKDLESLDFGPPIDESSVSPFPTTRGYFMRGKSEEVNEFLEKVAEFNTRTKLMLDITDIPLDEATETVKEAFNKHKLLNVATIKASQDNETELNVCMFNPFSGNKQERNPTIHCFQLHADNFQDQLKELEAFQVNRIVNLQEFPLRVGMFEYDMKCVAVYDEEGELSHYTYPDGELLMSIAKAMNFTPDFVPNLDGAKYGALIFDGSFLGGLADTEYDRVDIAANPKLISDYNTKKSVFLFPIGTTKLFFIIQTRPTSRHITATVYGQMDHISQVLAILMMILFPICYLTVYAMEARMLPQRMRPQVDSIRNILYTLGIIHCVSMNQPTSNAARLVVTAILFYSLIITALYSGGIVKDLNTDKKLGKISTLDELLEQEFTIGIEPFLTYSFREEGNDKISREMRRLSESVDDVGYLVDPAMIRLQEDDKFAFMWTEEMTGSFLDNFYDNKTGENYLETVPESVFEFYIAMMVPKSSHFFDRFNQVVLYYMESGLFPYNRKKATDDTKKIWYYRLKNGFVPQDSTRALKMIELQEVFDIFLVMTAISVMMFVVEVVVYLLKIMFRKCSKLY